jgi:hypothetical protein
MIGDTTVIHGWHLSTNRSLTGFGIVELSGFPAGSVSSGILAPLQQPSSIELLCGQLYHVSFSFSTPISLARAGTSEGASHHITGVVPSTLTDFKIPPPSFFTAPIKNEIPVRVDTTWHRQ